LGVRIDRSELLDKIWPETHVSDASLTQAIASLREALEDDPRESVYVTTLPRRGYKFVAKEIVGQPARIVVSATGATIEDLGSRNGTWVSDRRIKGPCDLRGDQIVIGSVVLFFRTAESMCPVLPLRSPKHNRHRDCDRSSP